MIWNTEKDPLPKYNEYVILYCAAEPKMRIGYRIRTDVTGEHWMDLRGEEVAISHWTSLPEVPV